MSDLFELFTKLNLKIEESLYETAKIGVINNGVITIKAVGRPDSYIVVRMLTGQDAGTVAAVRNRGVAPVYDTTIRVRRDPVNHNEWITYDVDPKFELANPTSSPANVPFHRHYIGSGLDDPVELRRFIPCRVWSSGGLTVNVDPFPYQWNGVNHFFPGITNLDVSSHIPSSGLQRFIVIGVDPVTNTVTIIDGPTYSVASMPLYVNLLAINTGSIITSGGISLANSQTAIVEANIYDMRPLLSAVGSGVVTNLSVTDPITNTGTSSAPNIGFAIKYNYSSIVNPTINDDQAHGYSRGSQWINTVSNTEFVCVRSVAGNALWKDITSDSDDIESLDVQLLSDAAMPLANTYYNSVTIGLTPGIWFVVGSVSCFNALLSTFSVKLWDGVTIFDSGSNASTVVKIPISTILSVESTTDYTISVSSNLTNSTISSTNNATQISAIKLASINIGSSGSPLGLLLAITKES